MRPRTGALLVIVAGLGCLAMAASAQQRRLLEGRVAPPSPGQSRPLAIDWQSVDRQTQSGANERGRAVNAKFLAANQAEMAKIAIPVMLPSDPDLAANLRIFANGPFYNASSRSSGLSFVITGSGRAFALAPRTARALPQASLVSRIPADGIVIEQTESGIDAGFSRFGVSYSVALECAKGHDDPRCGDPAYVRAIIGRLMVVRPGGARVRGRTAGCNRQEHRQDNQATAGPAAHGAPPGRTTISRPMIART